MPKPTNSINAVPIVIINQFQIVFNGVNNAANEAACNVSTNEVQNSFSALNFQENAPLITNPIEADSHKKSPDQMNLSVITPRGTADGYSIGIDHDILMSEVFKEFDILG